MKNKKSVIEEINETISFLETNLLNADNFLLKNDEIDFTEMNDIINFLKKRYFRARTNLNKYELEQKIYQNKSIDLEVMILEKRLKFIDHNLKNLESYLNLKISAINTKNLNIIVIIGLISAPLGIITGYFGMNFNRMTVFKHSNPNLFVILIFFIISMLIIIVYYYNVKPPKKINIESKIKNNLIVFD